MGAEAYHAALAEAVAVLACQDQGEPVQYLPHVTPEGGGGFLQGGEPYRYYGSSRGQAAGYRNQLTVDTAYTVLTLDNATAADFLSPTPALIVHGGTDDHCLPGQAQAVYDRFGDPKHLVWLRPPPTSASTTTTPASRPPSPRPSRSFGRTSAEGAAARQPGRTGALASVETRSRHSAAVSVS